MKHIKSIYEYNNVNEDVSDILKKMGKHATIAIINYLHENPELINTVMNSLFKSKDKNVQKSLKNF